MWWVAAALAAETPEQWIIRPGEFRNNAWTTPKGAFVLHPFLRSSYGITERIDVKTPILNIFFGPNVSIELGIVRDEDKLAISLEPYLDAGWGFRNWQAGASARVSFAAGPGWVNLNVGGAVGHLHREETVVDADGNESTVVVDAPLRLVPVNVGYDWPLQERTWLRFVATTDVGTIVSTEAPSFTLGGNWNHAFGRIRLALGAVLVVAQPYESRVDLPGQERLLKSATYPAPTFEIWGRW